MLLRDFVRPRAVARPADARGFSLLEVLVVIGVLAIAAAVGVPALLNQLSRLQLEGSASSVANLINQTRQRAIRLNEPHAVGVVGDTVQILRVVGESPLVTEIVFEFELTDGSTEIYTGGLVTCANTDILYRSTGVADDVGQICLTDEDGENILQVGILFAAGQPKIRKHLLDTDAPGGTAGFFEKTSAATSGTIWTWY